MNAEIKKMTINNFLKIFKMKKIIFFFFLNFLNENVS